MSSCCAVDTIGGAPPGGGGAVTVSAYELVFADEPNASLATGTEVIDGQNWEVQVAAADTLDIVNGSGLVWDAGAGSTAWSSGTQTSTYLYLVNSDLYALLACDPRAIVEVEMYCSTLTLDGAAAAFVGFYGPSGTPTSSGARMVGAERARSGVTQVFRARTTSLGGNYASNSDVWSVRSTAPSVGVCCSDTWGGDWPVTYTEQCQNAPANAFSSERDPESRLAIAFPTNGTGAAASLVVVERIRVRAWVL